MCDPAIRGDMLAYVSLGAVIMLGAIVLNAWFAGWTV
ncbi:hypothetical protein SEQ_HALENA_41 [Mycobacterium phage Halena]|uniref:Uncharacterized protein n=1 Tax=Mycobacterium phage Halena TaxID=2517952 RepID=A0A482JAZ4_9CAUD|nr:hypothetical protein SEQ_HALENA_41 [Mycobacterium phage Halena]